ncbi:hypothetical protein ZWY2020_052414 [Hordeum vulgare]|nr:hypothetical protein ZWY2020_052414 [Hordeum vulgare]
MMTVDPALSLSRSSDDLLTSSRGLAQAAVAYAVGRRPRGGRRASGRRSSHPAPHGRHALLRGSLLVPQPDHLHRQHLAAAAALVVVVVLDVALAALDAALVAHDVAEDVRLAAEEGGVRELPAVRVDLEEAVGVELPDEAGEVGGLEVRRQQHLREGK